MSIRSKELDVGDFTAPVNLYGGGSARRFYGEALVELARSDPRIVCLGADLSASTETDLFRDTFPDRLFHMGIAEANMIGAAAGMARSGDIPFVHSFCVFATRRCYDQIALQLAYPRTNVKIAGFMPGLTTLLGVSHQAIDDLALMRALPNMTVIEPGLASDVAPILTAIAAFDGPVYLRMRRFETAGSLGAAAGTPEIGRGQMLRQGNKAVVFAIGQMVEVALEAAEQLAADGIEISVANLHTLKPLDREFVVSQARKHGRVVTAENHSIIGGLGSAVAEALLEDGANVTFRRIGVVDTFAEGGSTPYLFEKYGISARAVSNAIRLLE
jgi:transketolase